MPANPRIAVVVPVHNGRARTARFLESFRAVTYRPNTIVVVDDGSTDGTASMLTTTFPEVVRLRGSGALWWAGATNRGVRWALARGYDYVLTINNDTQVLPDFLSRLVATAERAPRTIVGSRINYLHDPEVVWALGSEMNWTHGEIFHLRFQGELWTTSELMPAEALTGCGTLVPAQCFRDVGSYDARCFPQYHADAEFVLRAARHGWKTVIDTSAVVYNDAPNSAADHVRNWFGWIFSKRSAIYWLPLLAIHARYCPHRLRTRSLWQYYGWYFWRNDPRIQQLGWLLRPLCKAWRRVDPKAVIDSPPLRSAA